MSKNPIPKHFSQTLFCEFYIINWKRYLKKLWDIYYKNKLKETQSSAVKSTTPELSIGGPFSGRFFTQPGQL